MFSNRNEFGGETDEKPEQQLVKKLLIHDPIEEENRFLPNENLQSWWPYKRVLRIIRIIKLEPSFKYIYPDRKFKCCSDES